MAKNQSNLLRSIVYGIFLSILVGPFCGVINYIYLWMSTGDFSNGIAAIILLIVASLMGSRGGIAFGKQRQGNKGRETKAGKQRQGNKGRETKAGKQRQGNKGRETKAGKQRQGNKGRETKAGKQRQGNKGRETKVSGTLKV